MHSHPSHNHLTSNHKVATPPPSKCHPDATVHPPPTTYPGSPPPRRQATLPPASAIEAGRPRRDTIPPVRNLPHHKKLLPLRNHASLTCCDIPSLLRNHQLHPRQWQRLERILHQHKPRSTETCEQPPASHPTVTTQDCRNQQTPRPQTAPPSEPPPLRSLPHPTR